MSASNEFVGLRSTRVPQRRANASCNIAQRVLQHCATRVAAPGSVCCNIARRV
jgi:hypothetical protein